MSEEVIEKRTIKGDAPQPQLTVNERIQIARFWARFIIAMFSITIFAGILGSMIMLQDELPASAKDLINITIGPFLLVISGIAKYFYEQGGDIESAPPPQPEEKK